MKCEQYIQIYKYMSYSNYPILGQKIARARKIFTILCWEANPQLWHRLLKTHSPLMHGKAIGNDSAIVRLTCPRRGESLCQETFSAPSADEKTRNSDTECSNHHLWISTLRPKGLNCSKMKWWVIYTNLPVNVIVRLPYPWREDSQRQETFSATSACKKPRNYDTECWNHHPSYSTLRPNPFSHSKMKSWAIYTNLPVNLILRLPHSRR